MLKSRIHKQVYDQPFDELTKFHMEVTSQIFGCVEYLTNYRKIEQARNFLTVRVGIACRNEVLNKFFFKMRNANLFNG